ncbi:hypothetical protein WR25_07543 [Diploscapter pachys]|uniref:Uncharacterized protein n=1 Tax=Diploscapter pachys TaxID=2018661 RepID=A0A2A2JKB6_9BILA|nr:hypothetical protein WR25_07543 [Diploscapter pachys]
MMRILALSFVATVVLAGDIAEDAKQTVQEIATTKEGATYCPMPLVGKPCNPSSFAHYYECCGDLNKECCFRLQTWLQITLIVLGVIFLASIIGSIIRCLFCRRR